MPSSATAAGRERRRQGSRRTRRERAVGKSPQTIMSGRARMCARPQHSISHSAVKVGGFDENFAYGSDMDFCWRLTDVGYRIRCVPDAIVEHDWGTPRRNRRRSYMYGKARAHLYLKHRGQRKHMPRNDPMCVVYPLFLLGLPLTLIFPFYPLLLLIPAWRYRSRGVGGVVQVLVEHLLYGAGFQAGVAGDEDPSDPCLYRSLFSISDRSTSSGRQLVDHGWYTIRATSAETWHEAGKLSRHTNHSCAAAQAPILST